MNPLYGAIDCGTNTTRLLVSDGQTDVVRLERITGLGRGLTADGSISTEAIGRVRAVFAEYRGVLDEHGVQQCRVIATSAARDASNSVTFFDMAEDVLGHRPELVSGQEEGSLSFAGATARIGDVPHPILVVDIGGGSTEFAVGGEVVDAVMSVDMGSVRFTETFVENDPPRPEELSNMLHVIDAHLDDVVRELPGFTSAQTVVAVAGTATTVAAVEIGLQVYDSSMIDDFVLERAAAEDVFRTLATEALEDRVHNPGLAPGRADVIVAGSAILVGVMRYLGADHVIVREHDILDGLVASLLG